MIWLVKNSNLNFSLSETPYSLQFDIKKKFVNRWNAASSSEVKLNFVHDETFSSTETANSNGIVRKLEASLLHATELEKLLNSEKAKN